MSDEPISDTTCRICGCTDVRACPGGCFWVEPDLCSKCYEKLKAESIVRSATVHESMDPDSVEVTIRKDKFGDFQYTGFTIKVYGDFISYPSAAAVMHKLLRARKITSELIKQGPLDQPEQDAGDSA